MKKIVTIGFIFSGIFTFNAQHPAIEWQNTIGGSAGDFMQGIEQTADGGYIMGGFSSSNISGDKTENSNGGEDIWVVKTDSAGNIEWQNTIGGSGDDYCTSIKQTNDGGYLVFGASDSDISGDKTENSRGGLDLWILKLDATGNITWQRTYGGDQPDFECFGQQTQDGGYIVGGYSDSGVSGDKTDPSNGQRDLWVLKLDGNGDITWQNSIGGSLVEELLMIKQTGDGGYIAGAFSNSPVSGDKTEPNEGGRDYWIVKLNPNGSVQWDNTIGGDQNDLVRDVLIDTDGGYVVAGYSRSGISGEKTEPAQGEFDYWIVKLNASGTLTWQKTIGGAGLDYPRDLLQLNDGTYMVAGWSNSDVSGDKIIPSNGGYDLWLVQLDTSGNLIAQNSIGGSGDESGTYLIPTADDNFVFGMSSDSNTSGDKGDNNEGLDDYWIFKTTDAILGTTTHELPNTLLVYPNPFQNRITIVLKKNYEAGEVFVTNLLGQVVHSETFRHTASLALELAVDSGVYFVTIFTSEGTKTTLKVLKQ